MAKRSAIASLLRILTALVLIHGSKYGGAFMLAQKSQFHPIQTTTTATATTTITKRRTSLTMSLKPAALPLLDSGKALARSGELLIDATSAMGLYGGGLSAGGASIRNSGDCVAQAAASCRFKTGAELVCDEMREGATCLFEGVEKLRSAIKEAEADENEILARQIEVAIEPMSMSATSLEAAGAGIMKRNSISDIGTSLWECGSHLALLATTLIEIPGENEKELLKESSQRMLFASEQMKLAGDNLRGTTNKIDKPKGGKAWIKG